MPESQCLGWAEAFQGVCFLTKHVGALISGYNQPISLADRGMCVNITECCLSSNTDKEGRLDRLDVAVNTPITHNLSHGDEAPDKRHQATAGSPILAEHP